MKFYINKNFDNTDGIVPSETEKLVLNYIQKNGLIKREDVETLLNVIISKKYCFCKSIYASDLLSCFSILCLSSTLSIYTSKKFVFIIFPNSLIAV